MKITTVRLFEVSGTLEYEGPYWEERFIRPVDVYPEHKAEGPLRLEEVSPGRYRIRAQFVEIAADEGVTGLAGPVPPDQAYVIRHQLTPLLLGHDPLATERIWDRLYRAMVHGRKGVVMQAISVVDCALWDLKGKWLDAPVYRLLGGPTREAIPAYASTLGFSVEPEAAARRATELVAQGFRTLKWFFRHGPADGAAGVARNLELVRALREAVGPDVDLAFDCWMSWSVPYAVRMAERLAEYRPLWLEEPVLPDRIDQTAEIRRRIPIPIATGEHEYTRWGFKALLDAGAADVLQPDVYWSGGISEVMKVCALASAYDVVVNPHGRSVPATTHLLAAQTPTTCPLAECLLKWNVIDQFFLKDPIYAVNGEVRVPEAPGLGMELDEAKVEERREL